MIKKIVDEARLLIVKRSDLTGDGKVDKKDVEVALRLIEAKVAAQTSRTPIGALVVCTVVTAVIIFSLTRAFFSVCPAAPARGAIAPASFVQVADQQEPWRPGDVVVNLDVECSDTHCRLTLEQAAAVVRFQEMATARIRWQARELEQLRRACPMRGT